jgi:hypothetical protein
VDAVELKAGFDKAVADAAQYKAGFDRVVAANWAQRAKVSRNTLSDKILCIMHTSFVV